MTDQARAAEDVIRLVAERVHRAPFDSPLCDNPKCEEWCIGDARRVIDALEQEGRI